MFDWTNITHMTRFKRKMYEAKADMFLFAQASTTQTLLWGWFTCRFAQDKLVALATNWPNHFFYAYWFCFGWVFSLFFADFFFTRSLANLFFWGFDEFFGVNFTFVCTDSRSTSYSFRWDACLIWPSWAAEYKRDYLFENETRNK